MQEEVAKHTKKLYHAVKDRNHSFWEKVREVAIEILIIVFAVTLSIWLHSWSDHRHEQAETREFLQGLKVDLAKDIRLMTDNKHDLAFVDSNFQFLRRLALSPSVDTAANGRIANYIDIEMRTTHPNIGRYEGFKSSGKIGTIEIDALKQNILTYYQQTIPAVNDIEAIANTMQMKVGELEVDELDKMSRRAMLKTYKMQALLELATQNLEETMRNYDSACRQATQIVALIDRTAGPDQ